MNAPTPNTLTRRAALISVIALLSTLPLGCGDGELTLGAGGPGNYGTNPDVNVDQEWLTIGNIPAQDLANIQVQRNAIDQGLLLGKGAIADEINLTLEDMGVPTRYVPSTDSGTDYVPVNVGAITSCPFLPVPSAPKGTTDCRTLADRATVAAYTRISDLEGDNPLGSAFDSQRQDNEFWYEQGIITGFDNEAITAMRIVRQLELCDQDLEPRESAYEAGVEAGRQLYIERLNERFVEVGIDINYPDDNRQIEVCAADQALLMPARSRALEAAEQRAADQPLCADYNPGTVDEVADLADAEGQYLEGIRRGIESEHSLAEEKIFRVVPCNVSDPLVFDIAGDGVRLVPVHSSRANFDLFAVGVEQRTAWIQGDDALLVLDQNGNGSIDNGRELFGNFIGKSGYDEVATGFDKLALLDSDDNGVIDRHDAAFGDLRLWQDVDSDGQSQPSELHRLQTLGVSAIVLAAQRIYASDPQLTHRGQFVRTPTSMLETGSAMGSVYDAWFRYGRALPR
ncbi:MAG: hypothetical protein AUK47_19760 [Deltaproteobacteria bacterium CG2_30_63_29]|nr:MAG: hypothetical protein AUK47_19760 [Deltaproteobacteria bacterium CG2_30_63_29]PIV98582.1 MAG: hypothetical protein COW42_13880 [Deltaproteobacteria bacterium CG17_big_fil_post_rev_8_21_14_2_50_63_7]PJB47326.1 MAG: hypothetical protein CO108_04370 [Deltaproteobacteria bacterium CG_4_9_14_3_um_filter_63_12]